MIKLSFIFMIFIIFFLNYSCAIAYTGDIESEITTKLKNNNVSINCKVTFIDLKEINFTIDKIIFEIINATFIGGFTEDINFKDTILINKTISPKDDTITFDIELSLGANKYPIDLNFNLKLHRYGTTQFFILEYRRIRINLDDYLGLDKEITIIPYKNCSAKIILTHRFSNPKMTPFPFYYHFATLEENRINEASIKIKDMNGDPLKINNELVNYYVDEIDNNYRISIVPYEVKLEPRRTYWITISYITSDYVEKENSIYNLHKWISLLGKDVTVKVKIPLTNYISYTINKLNLQHFTPEPTYINTDDKYKILFWNKPSTDIIDLQLFEITVNYHYSINWFSITSYLFFTIFMSILVKYVYDKLKSLNISFRIYQKKKKIELEKIKGIGPYRANILRKYNIHDVEAFYKESNSNLKKILRLDNKTIKKMKEECSNLLEYKS